MDDILGFGKIAEALERGTREVREVIKSYIEPIAKAKGELRASEIQLQGFRRIVTMTKKADRHLSRAGIKKRTINVKVAIPIFEYTYRETEEELIDRWAGLLASSAAGDPIHVSFPQILSQLTAGEARILEKLYSWRDEIKLDSISNDRQTHAELRKEAKVTTEEEYTLAIENLYRQRLCADWRKGDARLFWSTGEEYAASPNNPAPILTPLGRHFVQACRGPKKGRKGG